MMGWISDCEKNIGSDRQLTSKEGLLAAEEVHHKLAVQ
jgi:hypothetical protein